MQKCIVGTRYKRRKSFEKIKLKVLLKFLLLINRKIYCPQTFTRMGVGTVLFCVTVLVSMYSGYEQELPVEMNKWRP